MGIAGIPGDILDSSPGFLKVNGYMDIPGYNGSLGLLYNVQSLFSPSAGGSPSVRGEGDATSPALGNKQLSFFF